MKALKYRNIAFIVIGVISFILNFTIQSGGEAGYRKTVIECFGDIFALTALILWAVGITGLMSVSANDKPRHPITPETKEDVER